MNGKDRRAAWVLVLLVTCSGLACVSAGKPDANGGGRAASEACFNAYRVDSFSALSERFVYVRLLGDEQYLLTLDSVYTSLPSATGIKLFGKFSRVCSDTGARITFMEFGRPVSCRIVRVEAVPSKETAQQLVSDRGPTKPKGER